MYQRQLNLSKINSFFLFGARGVGKTTLLNQSFSATNSLRLDLLEPQIFAELEANPEKLSAIIQPAINQQKWICIDEVQKVPALLDLVHLHIERDKALFALTGSSARKLRRGASNLLAGRAFLYRLFPLTPIEIGEAFDLDTALAWGSLPKIMEYQTDLDKAAYLKSYVQTYLQEEIVAEQIVRKLPPFRRFLQVAAQMNGKIINFSKIADEINSESSTVKSYFQVLEDTLIGFFIDPFHRSIRKRQRQAPKFYLFDTGVMRAQAQVIDVGITPQTYEYGRLFEAWIICTIKALLEYKQKQYQLSYLRTKDDAEIDLIIERAGEPICLIEIKSGTFVRSEEFTSLRSLADDFKSARTLCIYSGQQESMMDGVMVLPWQKSLEFLGLM